jgi:hypothetical protein
MEIKVVNYLLVILLIAWKVEVEASLNHLSYE